MNIKKTVDFEIDGKENSLIVEVNVIKNTLEKIEISDDKIHEFILKLLKSEKERIKYALALSKTREESMELCGLPYRTFYRRLKKYKLSGKDELNINKNL